MNDLPVPHPLLVVILDGWGISFVKDGNAIAVAKTPTMDVFLRHYPSAALLAASIEVGLPWGEVGNSEVGHTNIGAGQVRYQVLPQIDKAIENRSFFDNKQLLDAFTHTKKHRSSLHLMGLASPGGVHSHLRHLFALLEMAAARGVRENVFIHIFTDGRDSPPQSALTYLRQLEDAIGQYGVGRIASVTGRFYAMDRNENWDRTQLTYDMLTGGPRGTGASSPEQAIQQAYEEEIYDEMIPPMAITRGGGPITTIKKDDAVIFFNYRPDRARQLTRALADPAFSAWQRPLLDNLYLVTMSQYDPELPVPAAFTEKSVEYPLARILSEQGLRQLHIAETEKYAHVTYYLNGGHEQPFDGEDHVLIKSSGTRNFAEEPEMRAAAITERVLSELDQDTYDVYFINYANADMLGHTGNFDAAVSACEFVDTQLGRLYERVIPQGGALLITADHGNAEEMINPQTGTETRDHSSNPVPLHYVVKQLERKTPRSDVEISGLYSSPIGVLADTAPTILDALNVAERHSMSGISLLSSLQ